MTSVESVEKINELLQAIGNASTLSVRVPSATPAGGIVSLLHGDLKTAHGRMVRGWNECMFPIFVGCYGENEDKWKERVSPELVAKLCFLMRPGVRDLLACVAADDPHQIGSMIRELADLIKEEVPEANTPPKREIIVPGRHGETGKIVVIEDDIVKVSLVSSDPERFGEYVFKDVNTFWRGDRLKPENLPDFDPSSVAQRPDYYLVACRGLSVNSSLERLSHLGLKADDFTSFAAFRSNLRFYLNQTIGVSTLYALGPNSVWHGPYGATLIPEQPIDENWVAFFTWYNGKEFDEGDWVLAYKGDDIPYPNSLPES